MYIFIYLIECENVLTAISRTTPERVGYIPAGISTCYTCHWEVAVKVVTWSSCLWNLCVNNVLITLWLK